jgi:hypothetical protein
MFTSEAAYRSLTVAVLSPLCLLGEFKGLNG